MERTKKVSEEVLKKQQEKEMEIQSILLKANECKEESLFIDEEGCVKIKNEVANLLDTPIDDPNEKYELYYKAIMKVLYKYLPKGKENKEARKLIYEEKKTFLTRGHRKNNNSIRHADSRMGYCTDFRELVDIISDWASSDRNPFVLYTKLRDLNKSKGYGLPDIEK